MEGLIARQHAIFSEIQRTHDNFKKDSETRKTRRYIQERLELLDSLWSQFEKNDEELMNQEDKSHQYFVQNVKQVVLGWYEGTRAEIESREEKPFQPGQENADNMEESAHDDSGKKDPIEFDTTQFRGNPRKPSGGDRLAELLQLQGANFRAFMRLVKTTCIDDIKEKWEIEDKLKYLESRWSTIDRLHLQIDGILDAKNYESYYVEFAKYESQFEALKRKLNEKLSTSLHQQQALPKIDIPTFSGSYTQWPTFMDLYLEAIHNNPAITKTQKMQHLKGRLRGEAEKLVQHLHIAPENYNTCWELLNHRYNNKSLLFTKNFQAFMRQPNIQKQSSFELKRLYDTSNETIHAIHNLGIDTSSWDPVLVYILCEKLDTETYSEYMQSKSDPREIPTFDHFMDFIETKFIALEPLQKKRIENIAKPIPKTQFNTTPYPYNKNARQTYMQPHKSSFNNSHNFNAYKVGRVYTDNCQLCNNQHPLYLCQRFLDMADAEKLKFIAKYNICRRCLYYHKFGFCKTQKSCKECNDSGHNTILHNAYANCAQIQNATKPTPKLLTTPQPPLTTNKSGPNKNLQINFASNDDEETLLATALLNVATATGEYITLRAFIDPGSQVTLVTEKTAQLLGLQRQYTNASISGIGTLSSNCKGRVQLVCKSLLNDFQFTTEALIMNRVVNNLPNTTFAKKPWPHIANLTLADPEYNVSRPIDILLDAHVFTEILMHGLIKGIGQQPKAINTQLGWILAGNVSFELQPKTFHCNVVTHDIEDFAKYWEVEDISADTNTAKTTEGDYCENFYIATTKRLENGKYEVRLPMKPGFEQLLGKSKPHALAQFMQLERRLNKDAQLSESYIKFMQEYIQMSHMKESKADTDVSCYLPHHGVLKQDSLTTKLRVVFNASQKTESGHSLNDLMECGPKLHQDLMTLLLGWRLYKYVFTADCEKMYRMILVNADDQKLQKILWRESKQSPLKEYNLCTVTYGTKAAPFLALRTLKQLAQDDAHKYPLAADVIKHEMYVDDVLSGSNSIEQAQELQHQLINMLQGAGLTLRKWTSNEPALIENLSSSELNETTMHFTNDGTTKALGLQWNPKNDSFAFRNKINTECNGKLTKRELLSEISKIFDPLGWLTPLTIKAKLLFQKIWLIGSDWDDILPKEIQDEWMQFTNDLHNILQCDIPRWLGDTTKKFQIHGFCDASEKAYSCAIYLQTLDENNESIIRLIAAKSRLAPVKNKMTLPRLELSGALLLATLMKRVCEAFKWDAVDKNTFAWTDSMIVLGWLNGDVTKWKSFVRNRVQQVHDVIPKQHWSYVKSEDNAADCATRGVTCTQLLQHSLWWSGPKWLKNYEKHASTKIDIMPTTCESKQTHVTTGVAQSEPSSIVIELLDRHSDMTHITRVVAWIMRFAKNPLKTNTEKQKSLYLTSTELKNAEKVIVKQVQLHAFKDEIIRLKGNKPLSSKSNILSLNPYLDEDDILRVGGRLQNSTLNSATKHPMLLPHNHIATDLFILQAHHKTLHGGPKLTLTHLRQRVWIVGGYRAVKRVLHKCTICRRFSMKPRNQLMADLPAPRVTASRPFANTGVDFSGHVEIKANKGRGQKTLLAYVAVFVCLATKAIHLELVTELSSMAFLAAFQRFCARRGKPRNMYSDNGTNFVGANRILMQQYRDIINTIDSHFLGKISEMGVTWHFNAPIWPTAGGLWEAAVKSMKYHLKRVIGERRLTYEEFTTLLCQIEACLNSRPLCTVTEDADDIECLTPGHFITGTPLMTIPEPDNKNYDLRKRWQVVQKISKDFWKKWSQEYLQQLQARLKWQRQNTDPRINDIVCIKDENIPAGKWALGRVTNLHPGKDGHVRVVTLKTAKGELKRPITKLVPLIEAESNKTTCTDNESTRRQNRTKKMSLKNFLCYALLLLMTLITPTMQEKQTTKHINIIPLTQNQTLYFDKMAEIQEIKDEWKLVFYYNLTSYWKNIDTIQQYVQHIKQFQNDEWVMQFQVFVNQLDQSLNELIYYNELLRSPDLIQHRYKRGLVDGIGYVANSLFGVLDQRFAEKYENDINNIQLNENHLLQLLKNQTSVLEAEHNIVQRNEETMIKHFNLINNHLNSIDNDAITQKHNTNNAFYVITSAIAAEAMIQNLKFIQQTLINTLTNMYQGHIDVHLLSPNQLQNELNKIARHLPHDLTLPEAQDDDVTNIYKLLRIHARITQQYLLMEIKVPLLSDELYELDKLISIPQSLNTTHVVNVIPTSDLIAFNIKQYSFMSLDQTDISECQKVREQKLMCKLNHPVYSTVSRTQSICDIQLIRNNEIHNAYCHTEIKTCTDKWIKLHKQNTWFYYCCDVCIVHIVCSAGMTTESLRHTGLITLTQGCVLRGDTFMLYANMEHATDNIIINEPNAMIIPKISPINNIINTSIKNTSFHIETHEQNFQNIQKKLNEIKEQTALNTLTTHDMHHYIMIYAIVVISTSLFVASVCYFRKVSNRREHPRQGEERRNAKVGSRKANQPNEEDDSEDSLYSKVKKDKGQNSGEQNGKSARSVSEVQFDTFNHSDVCNHV